MKFILYSHEMDNFVHGINHKNQMGRLVFDEYNQAYIYNWVVWDGEPEIMNLSQLKVGDIKYNLKNSFPGKTFICEYD